MRLEDRLGQLPSLDLLTLEDRVLLARLLEVRRHRPDEVLMRQGEASMSYRAGLHILFDISVRVIAMDNGSTRVNRILGPGSLVGVASMFDDQPRSATVTVQDHGSAAFLSRVAYRELVNPRLPAAVRFQLVLGRQLARDLRTASTTLSRELQA